MASESSSEDEVGPRFVPSVDHEDEESDGVGPTLTTSLPGPVAKKFKRVDDVIPVDVSDSVPTAGLYEYSYMHRQPVSHVLASSESEFIITISSADAIVKFWKKLVRGIEFVKAFDCDSPILDASVSSNGRDLVVLTSDMYLRLFDIESFNLIGMASIGRLFPRNNASKLCFVSRKDALSPTLAVASKDTGSVMLIETTPLLDDPKSYKPKKEFLVHDSPVVFIKYSCDSNTVVSIDREGFIEVWDPVSLGIPIKSLFSSKFDTDLFELKRDNTTAVSLAVSASHFAILTSLGSLKIFRIADCKLVKAFDETLDTLLVAQNDPLQRVVHVEARDLADRLEREETVQLTTPSMDSMVFDQSGDLLFYSTVVGIKLLDWKRNKLLTVLGRVEGTERFMNLALYQGKPKMRIQELTGGSQSGPLMETDPTLICTSYDRERFFLFTKRLPGEQRDVFNEAALEATKVIGTVTKKRTPSIAHKATIYTTMGDIVIELYPKECRKTVENFSTHARNGYYDSVIFHRVIKNFMIQTGDPRGDGTGGTSIWGTDFQDEFNSNLRHDKPYMVSMANTGAPNTNGSQFFITTVAAPWLNNKHTVFGRVLEGIEVVQAIEDLETDNNDRPMNQDVRILSIKVV